MKIIISYESKWSASFADTITKKTKVTSLSVLTKEDKDKSKLIIGKDDDYEVLMNKIGNVYNNFDYKTITKDTVLGILARLLGEVRYLTLALKDSDHIIHYLAPKISFKLENRKLYNETIMLSTPLKESINNGQGLVTITSNNSLASNNLYSRFFYAFLNIENIDTLGIFIENLSNDVSICTMDDFMKNNNLYEDNISLYKIIEGFKNFKKVFNYLEAEYKEYINDKNDIKSKTVALYISMLEKLGEANYKNHRIYLNAPYRTLAGILMYSVCYWLKRSNPLNSQIIDSDIFNKNGNITGISNVSANNIGNMTIKNFYGGFAEEKTTFSSPYFFDTQKITLEEGSKINKLNKLGLGKEDGILEINIDIEKDQALLLKEQIEDAGVSVFQMGKKGLAYIERIIL